MLFNEFGEKGNPVILGMHGMCQDWHSEYKMLKPLEKDFRLIVPAMDGMYPNSEFTSFADQCRQIEEFIKENYNGHLDGVCGQSQGGLMMVELLTRGNINIDTAVLDGTYVAHQGKLAGYGAYWMMKYYKDHKRPPKVMDIMMHLMGLTEEAYSMFDVIYWDVSYESMKRNLLENFTYRTSPNIANTKTKVYLWCGSKEPYALKSHKILKRYLKNYEEEIMKGLGHGEFFLRHQDEMCQKITKAISRRTKTNTTLNGIENKAIQHTRETIENNERKKDDTLEK